MFSKDLRFPDLLDVYGDLLKEKKREILEYYYNDDFSLSEISELTGISRQGVRDSIKKSESELENYENSLHLLEKIQKISGCVKHSKDLIETLKADHDPLTLEKIKGDLEEIESITG